jgi:hypothetical protein
MADRQLPIGETNFHPYDVHMDETFGAALATLDRSMRAVTIGIQRLFFHQGTINQGKSCMYQGTREKQKCNSR